MERTTLDRLRWLPQGGDTSGPAELEPRPHSPGRLALAWTKGTAMSGDLVVERPEGLYCPSGDFYIDPWRPVHRAVITHAHADHARVGHGHYLAAAPAQGVLRARLGDIALQPVAY